MNKKGIGLRGYIILAVLILSGYSLWPSIQLHTKSGAEKQQFAKENPKVAAKAVNFGLDLAGGTSIVLEIDKSGLKPDEAADIQERSLEIVRNRVDQFGLSEPQITPSGDSRIIAELAGVEADAARSLVGGTALLEFKLVAEAEKFEQTIKAIDDYLSRSQVNVSGQSETQSLGDVSAAEPDVAPADDSLLIDSTVTSFAGVGAAGETDSGAAVQNADQSRSLTSYFRPDGSGSVAVLEQDMPAVRAILEIPAVQTLVPRDLEFAWGRGFEKASNGDKIKKFYLLKRRAEMDGKEIATAHPYRVSDGLSAGQIAVSLKFKGLGPKKFASVTGNNVGKQMAIVLDGQVMSAPVIRDRIPNGEAQITGLDDMNEAKQLSVVLRAGALPAPMNIVELRNVGAGLGEENIQSGFYSAAIGFVLSLIFFLIYYRYAGVVANIGMAVNLLMIGAILSMFNATLTLPGIAGAVLTAAMSLDANVIIYERIREELRAGQLARTAVAKGYEKAFSAIIDSNLTTFLTAFILYKIGSGPVKGFGLTLMIGLAVSMFSALTVTRAIFDWKLSRSDSNTINIGKGIDWFNRANLDILSKVNVYKVISGLLLAFSLGSIVVKGFEYSIDFTGGVVYAVEYQDKESHAAELSDVLDGTFRDANVRKLGGTSSNQYMVSVQTDESDEATVKAMRAEFDKAIANAGSPSVISEDVVGPTIGKELRFNAILALVLASLVIGLYVWARFGKLGMGFGAGALVSLFHDVFITIGAVSLLGLPVDGAMVAAVLTVLGYSVNDTIVIYDRIRESTQLLGKESFAHRTNLSVNQSFARTLITSVTTLFVCAVLAVMGGSSIRDFGIVMIVGVVVGTYSSICVSSPFVVWWSKRFKGGL